LIAHALPNETKSSLAFVEFAKPRTQPALDAARPAASSTSAPDNQIVLALRPSSNNIGQKLRPCTPYRRLKKEE
jgi:hypothetical protein